MSYASRFTDKDIEIMVSMRLAGASYRQIAQDFEISHAHAHYILTGQSEFAKLDSGLVEKLKRVVRPHNRALTRQQVRQVHVMWRNYLTHEEIAQEMGVSRTCITSVLNGITYREVALAQVE